MDRKIAQLKGKVNLSSLDPSPNLSIQTDPPENTPLEEPEHIEISPLTTTPEEILKNIPPQHHPSKFIIGIIASNRPNYLKILFKSMAKVHGFNKENTILFQYGNDPGVNTVVQDFGIKQIQNPVKTHHNNIVLTEGAQHIALHYQFTLTQLFDVLYPSASHVILIEDDMILSPDFLLYFSQLHEFFSDPSVYAISAFNDNGFSGQVSDSRMVYKTDFLIGLGWLVKGQWWRQEWRPIWPMNHWDHFLRQPGLRRGRSIIYPEVPRIYHSGYKGTHSNLGMFEKYFRNTKLNRFIVKLEISHLVKYDEWLNDQLTRGKQVKSLKEITRFTSETVVFSVDLGRIDSNWEKIATYFRIWHSTPIRGEYKGTVIFKWANNLCLLKKVYNSGDGIIPIQEFDEQRVWNRKDRPTLVDIRVGDKGQSCTAVCATGHCDLGYIHHELNNCHALRHHFKCDKCTPNQGSDQPALDVESSLCHWNQWSPNFPTTCEGSHIKTRRLCACQDPTKIHDQIEREQNEMIES